MDDAFEIIEENVPNKVAEIDDRVLLRELLQQLGTQKLIVEQEEIDVTISEPQDVDGPIIEDYFCENGVVSEEPFSVKVIEDTTSAPEAPRQQDVEGDPLENMPNHRFSTGPYLLPQNLSASVMLTAPLSDLAKPIGLERRNSLPILCRERDKENLLDYNFFLPQAPDRSRSTPVQTPSTTACAEGGDIDTALSLPSNGLNLLEDDVNIAGNDSLPAGTPSASISSVPHDQEEVEPSIADIDENSLEDVGSSIEKVECTICLSASIDIPPDIPPKVPIDFLTVACTSFTIYPVFQGRKILFIKLTDLVCAMLIAATVIWSYREAQRLRTTNLTNCATQQVLASAQHSNFSNSLPR